MRLSVSMVIMITFTLSSCHKKDAPLSLTEKQAIDTNIVESFDKSMMILSAYHVAHGQLIDSIRHHNNQMILSDIVAMDSLGNRLGQLSQSCNGLMTSFKQYSMAANNNLANYSPQSYSKNALSGLDSILTIANEISLRATLIKEKYHFQE